MPTSSSGAASVRSFCGGMRSPTQNSDEPERAEHQLLGEHRVRRAAGRVALHRRRREHHDQPEQRQQAEDAEDEVQRGQRAAQPLGERGRAAAQRHGAAGWRAGPGRAGRRDAPPVAGPRRGPPCPSPTAARLDRADRARSRPAPPASPATAAANASAALGVVAELVHRRRGGGEQDDVTRPGQRGGPADRRLHHAAGGSRSSGIIGPSWRPSTSTTGTSGACRASAATIARRRCRSPPPPAGRPACAATSSSTDAPFSRPPATQTTGAGRLRGQRRGRGVRVGRLGVVDVAHAGDRRRPGPRGAGPAGTPASPAATCPGATPAARASAAAASASVSPGGPPGVHGGDARELDATRPARGAERRRSDAARRPVDARSRRSGWPGAGSPSVTPTRRARRRRGQQRGRRRVVDPRDRDRPAQRPRLGRGVRGHRAVPVEVVLGDVEHAPRGGHHRRRPVQLEARQLHGEHPPPRPDRVDHRVADVPAGHGVEPGRAQDRLEHAGGGGLAVGAGHRQPRRRASGAPAPIHHASSGSPTTGTPAAAAAATSGWSGRRPGPVTTRPVRPAAPPGTGDGALGQVGQRRRARRR